MSQRKSYKAGLAPKAPLWWATTMFWQNSSKSFQFRHSWLMSFKSCLDILSWAPFFLWYHTLSFSWFRVFTRRQLCLVSSEFDKYPNWLPNAVFLAILFYKLASSRNTFIRKSDSYGTKLQCLHKKCVKGSPIGENHIQKWWLKQPSITCYCHWNEKFLLYEVS